MNRTTVLFAIIAALVFTGCDNTINPLDEDRGHYSIYGALDLNSPSNYIRVKDLNAPLTAAATRELDVTVTFENLDNGDSDILEDSVVRFEEIYTHNFRVTLPVNPQTGYKVKVEGENGLVSATATTPARAATNVIPEMEDCETPVNIAFEPVESLVHLEVSLGFYYNNNLLWGRPDLRQSTSNPNEIIARFTPLRYINDVLDPMGEEPTYWCHELSDDKFEVEYTHYGPDFFEHTLSDTVNIPGGAGQFGAYYEDAFTFSIDTVNVCFPFC